MHKPCLKFAFGNGFLGARTNRCVKLCKNYFITNTLLKYVVDIQIIFPPWFAQCIVRQRKRLRSVEKPIFYDVCV